MRLNWLLVEDRALMHLLLDLTVQRLSRRHIKLFDAVLQVKHVVVAVVLLAAVVCLLCKLVLIMPEFVDGYLEEFYVVLDESLELEASLLLRLHQGHDLVELLFAHELLQNE